MTDLTGNSGAGGNGDPPANADGGRQRDECPRRLVPRPRLNVLIDEGTHHRVTLVVGGAGWGKTSLLRSWMMSRRQPGPVAWLTLLPEHRTAAAFEAAVVSAIGRTGIELASLREPAPGLDRLSAPVVLILDDFHVLDRSEALTGLAGLLEQLPARLRLVVLSRTDPALPLHRLRARGELSELRTADLAFDLDEATQLVGLPRPGFLTDDLATVVAQTEGWALGLRLVASPGTGRDGELVPVDPTAGRAAMRDYLLHEVVAAQPATVRRFLLRTSIAEQVSAGLATALTGETHGVRILEHLQKTTGFVTRVGSGSPWFRYHGQLRATLLQQFDRDEPELVPAMHGLAARWYTREHAMPQALRHATAAADWVFLGRLTAGHAVTMVVSSERGILLDTIRRIPQDMLATTAELTLCEALMLFADGDFPAIPARITRARGLLAGREPGDRLAVEVALDLLHAVSVLRARGDMPGLVASTTAVLSQLSTARADQVPSLRQIRALALNNKGVGLLWLDRQADADRYLWAGLTSARLAGLTLAEIEARAHLSVLAYLQGSLREAEDHATAARTLARQYGVENTSEAAWGHLALALIELERDHVVEAHQALRRTVRSGIQSPETSASAVGAALVRVHLLLSAEDPMAAHALLLRTRRVVRSLRAPGLIRWIRLTEAEVNLALRQPARVVAVYAGGDQPVLIPAEQACLGRAYLALGDHAGAEEMLTRAANSTDLVAAVTGWTGLALLAEAQGFVSRSVNAVTRAGALARRDGIRRPFRKFDTARITALIGRQRWLQDDETGAAADLYVDSGPSTAVQPSAIPAEALSERETDVLRFLPTVLTALEIAEDLGISVNTVKAHTRSIYRKLGAARRREAVIRARQLGLL